uniref:D-isomer specific 2-hydroxyacid dehydrogenase domain protein n=1 Tax=Rhizophora mucronata TaxID=61149 RepID=A0A2P2JRQ7_RHIMU
MKTYKKAYEMREFLSVYFHLFGVLQKLTFLFPTLTWDPDHESVDQLYPCERVPCMKLKSHISYYLSHGPVRKFCDPSNMWSDQNIAEFQYGIVGVKWLGPSYINS